MKKTPEPDRADPYDKALGLLARREHSAHELGIKLAQRGYDAAERAETIERLRAKDFQNDRRFAEMLVRTRIEAGYGPRWIVAELKTHAIAEAAARELLDAAAPDWLEVARRQLRRRHGNRPPRGFSESAKRAAFLLRRGFDASTARLAAGNSVGAGHPDDPD
jgi:regulatory protein